LRTKQLKALRQVSDDALESVAASPPQQADSRRRPHRRKRSRPGEILRSRLPMTTPP